MRVRAAAAAIAAALVSVAPAAAASAGSTWTTYHGDAGRTGVDSSEPGLNPIRPAWSNALDGAKVYGQPVVADGRVFVATELDDVYALDARNGRVLWHANIGAPLQDLGPIGCGDIEPLGITSTPVIDLAAHTLFVVGEVSTGGEPPVHHQLVGFNLLSGAITVSTSADPFAMPAGQVESQLQQRAALAIGSGRVYVAYGGFDGDCGDYSGWVVGVDEHAARPKVEFDTTPGAQGGAVWQGGGGPSIDGQGNVYITTGNPNGTGAVVHYGDDIVKLGPSLGATPSAFFHDGAATPNADLDLGTGDATLVPPGPGHPTPDVFAVGKTHIGYLVTQANLTGVAAIPNVCGGDADGGEAYDAATNSIYVPCRGRGIQQVNLGTHAAGWLSSTPGGDSAGPPVLVDGELWSVVWNTGTLTELDPRDGRPLQSIALPSGVPNFASPTPALGLLIVGADHGVAAFGGPPPPPPSAQNPAYDLVASDGGVFPFGAPFQGSLGAVHLNRPIVGAAGLPSGAGYYLVASDGGVFPFGRAPFFGSLGAVHLNRPIVGMAVDPGGGYWLVASDGGVFQFGPAPFLGSLGAVHLNQPIVGMAALPSGRGYWLVAADGGIFQFGAAPFHGSTGAVHLNRPIVAMAAAPDGGGYWLTASDGGVFPFGTARFEGSLGAIHLNAPIVSMLAAGADNRYWLFASDGGVFPFGSAAFRGSLGAVRLNRPIVASVGIP